MKKLFDKLTKRHNPHQIFNDFLELSSLAISNSVDYSNYKAREDRYIEISRKYTSDEIKIFTEILAKLTIELKNPRDVLGEMLMYLEEGNSKKGQYFTPFHISLLTASLGFDEEKLKSDGLLTVNEPSCGGGALIIALYTIMKNKGYNPQKQLRVFSGDLDLKSVFMCYIQLSLLGISAVIHYSNAMNGEVFSTWITPGFYTLGANYE